MPIPRTGQSKTVKTLGALDILVDNCLSPSVDGIRHLIGWLVSLACTGLVRAGHARAWELALVLGLAHAQGSVAAAFMGVMPASALALSYLLLGEPFRWVHLLGFGIVFASVLLISQEHASE